MKVCPVCGSDVKGRRDKIYCSDSCKSSAQYDKRLEAEGTYYWVDKKLKSNRKILKQFNRSGYSTMRCQELHDLGFDPLFYTHTWANKEGLVYKFCFEFGFASITQNAKAKYLLVKWQPYMGSK